MKLPEPDPIESVRMRFDLPTPLSPVPEPIAVRGTTVIHRSGSIDRQAQFFDVDVSVLKLARRVELPCKISLGDRIRMGFVIGTKMSQQIGRLLGFAREASVISDLSDTRKRDLLLQWQERTRNRKPAFEARLFAYPKSAPVLLKGYSRSDESELSPSSPALARRSVSVGDLLRMQAPVVGSENASTVRGGKAVNVSDTGLDALYSKLVTGSPTSADQLDSLLAGMIELQQQDQREGAQLLGGTGSVVRFMAQVEGLPLEKSRALLDAVMRVEFSAQIVLVRAQNRWYLTESKRSEFQESNVQLVALIEKLHTRHGLQFSPRAYQDHAFREGPLTIPERETLVKLIIDKEGKA